MILHKVLKHLETMALDLDGAGRNVDEKRETEKFHHFSSAQNQLIYSQAQWTFPKTRCVHTTRSQLEPTFGGYFTQCEYPLSSFLVKYKVMW